MTISLLNWDHKQKKTLSTFLSGNRVHWKHLKSRKYNKIRKQADSMFIMKCFFINLKFASNLLFIFEIIAHQNLMWPIECIICFCFCSCFGFLCHYDHSYLRVISITCLMHRPSVVLYLPLISCLFANIHSQTDRNLHGSGAIKVFKLITEMNIPFSLMQVQKSRKSTISIIWSHIEVHH